MSKLLISVILALLCMPLPARADGKVFKMLVEDPTPAEMPDQQAMIAYCDGVETLAIETHFTGDPTNFAWVVPLPSMPEVSAVTTGSFRTLEAVFHRRVQDSENPWWLLACVVGVPALAVVFRFKPMGFELVIVSLIILVLLMLLLPALAKARAGPAEERADDSVVLNHEQVGNYEVTTIGSGSASDLVDWLVGHGFAVSAQDRVVIQSYSSQGWVFVAANCRRAQAESAVGAERMQALQTLSGAPTPIPTLTPHPLAFRFKSPHAVYPMRLTGANSTVPLTVALYVFADGTAEAPGWEMRQSAEVRIEESVELIPDEPFMRRRPNELLTIAHPGVVRLVDMAWGRAPWGTKLTRTLSPAEMDHDVVLGIGPHEFRQETVRTTSAAGWLGLNVASVTIALGSLLVAVAAAGRPPRMRAAMVGLVCAIGVAAGTATGLAISTVRVKEYPRIDPYESLVEALHAWSAKRVTEHPAGRAGQLRERVRALLPSHFPSRLPSPIEEDSPGNYVIDEQAGAVRLRYFNDIGQERRVGF